MAKTPISADSHITEPPNCYIDHIDPSFRDRAPHLINDEKYGDVYVIEGMEKTLDRACKYASAGADLIFVEACTELEQYQRFKKITGVPVLANLTEFGQTPLFTLSELDKVGVDVALYPLSAFRAMSNAAEKVYRAIREKGTQRGLVDGMQSRNALYDVLNYHSYERQIDDLFDK